MVLHHACNRHRGCSERGLHAPAAAGGDCLGLRDLSCGHGAIGDRDLRGVGRVPHRCRPPVRFLWPPPGDPRGDAPAGRIGPRLRFRSGHRGVPGAQDADRPGGGDASADLGGGVVRHNIHQEAGTGGERLPVHWHTHLRRQRSRGPRTGRSGRLAIRLYRCWFAAGGRIYRQLAMVPEGQQGAGAQLGIFLPLQVVGVAALLPGGRGGGDVATHRLLDHGQLLSNLS